MPHSLQYHGSRNPLYSHHAALKKENKFQDAQVFTGRYGLGSKDCNPAQIIAVYNNTTKPVFTLGINDDVTHLSLDITENPNTTPEGTTCCKFWGLGSDGTVGANKNSIKIIGDHTDMYAQAYFAYDSKKSGGVTISHLRFGKTPIKSTYFINKANFVACHNPSYIDKYDMVEDVVPGGSFLLNCHWTVDELDEKLPAPVKAYIAKNNINFYIINANKVAREIGLGNKTNTVLQSAFFSIANIIPPEDAITYMKKMAYKSFAKKGDDIVNMNYAAIEKGAGEVIKVTFPLPGLTARASSPSTRLRATTSSWSTSLTMYRSPLTHSAATRSLFPHSLILPTVRSRRAPLLMRSAVSQLTFPSGSPRTVSSVTSVHSSARTLLSVRLS